MRPEQFRHGTQRSLKTWALRDRNEYEEGYTNHRYRWEERNSEDKS